MIKSRIKNGWLFLNVIILIIVIVLKIGFLNRRYAPFARRKLLSIMLRKLEMILKILKTKKFGLIDYLQFMFVLNSKHLILKTYFSLFYSK